VSWFEPPIVCRFETEDEFLEMKEYDEELFRKKRMEDDDYDETEDDLDFSKAKKSEKVAVVKKPTKEKDVKVVEDFNLLEVPKNVNLKPLLEEFVIPMIPDGYEIQFKPKKSSSGAVDCYTDRMYAINDIVYQTRQARPLFPSCKTKKVFKIYLFTLQGVI
jgi:cancer susceptibility candidate protein 1